MASVLVVAVGTATVAQAQTLHYSWMTITGDTTLQPGESVLLGLQAEFTGADGYAGGQFNIRIDGFAHDDDSVWIAGTRGVDNLSGDGDTAREVFGDDRIGRVLRFQNSPGSGSLEYVLAGDLVGSNSPPPPFGPGFIDHAQFGQPLVEPDRSNPITFFTMEFFAGDTPGQRVFTMQVGVGVVYILRDGVDLPAVVSDATADPITITVVPAPASLTLLVLVGVGAHRRRTCERRHL